MFLRVKRGKSAKLGGAAVVGLTGIPHREMDACAQKNDCSAPGPGMPRVHNFIRHPTLRFLSSIAFWTDWRRIGWPNVRTRSTLPTWGVSAWSAEMLVGLRSNSLVVNRGQEELILLLRRRYTSLLVARWSSIQP